MGLENREGKTWGKERAIAFGQKKGEGEEVFPAEGEGGEEKFCRGGSEEGWKKRLWLDLAGKREPSAEKGEM